MMYQIDFKSIEIASLMQKKRVESMKKCLYVVSKRDFVKIENFRFFGIFDLNQEGECFAPSLPAYKAECTSRLVLRIETS